MTRWLIVFGVACSSSQQRTEQPAPRTPDAALAAPIDAATPRDALVTALIPTDAPPAVRVIVTESDPCGFVLDQIYFAEGSAVLQGPQRQVAESVAEMIACILKTTGGSITKLEVQGHADDKERDPLRLSEERAVAIANLLIEKGVPARILVPVGYANTQPIDRRKTAAARAKNRRVAFLILERKPE